MQQNPAIEPTATDFVVGGISDRRKAIGRTVIGVATALAILPLLVQLANALNLTDQGFDNWRPIAIVFVVWSVALCVGLILARGQRGQQAVFLLPAVLITFAFVLFPTLYAVFIAFNDWNLSAAGGRSFNGFDNFRKLFRDERYWTAMLNMAYYVLAVLAQYGIALLLAVLLNQRIRGRKFFRVVFLLPFMLSPVAVAFIIGKTIMNSQYGPLVPVLEKLGFQDISFYEDPWLARLNIMVMDAWYSIPFMMVLILAGLQAIPLEILESSRVDGASAWRTFKSMTFPLLLPISITAVVLRVIFELKLLDVVRIVTGGGPGSATDTMSLLIYREGVEKTNVGYATAFSTFYLVLIIAALTIVLWGANKWIQKFT